MYNHPTLCINYPGHLFVDVFYEMSLQIGVSSVVISPPLFKISCGQAHQTYGTEQLCSVCLGAFTGADPPFQGYIVSSGTNWALGSAFLLHCVDPKQLL